MALDIQALLQESRKVPEIEDHDDFDAPTEVDGVGVLYSRTTSSPETKWVFPLLLGKSRTSAVILIGDFSLKICKISEDGKFTLVTQRSDFEARNRIRNAAMYCGRSKGESSDEERAREWLVLVLEARELMFVSIAEDQQYHVELLSHSVPLPIGPQTSLSGLELLGGNLAIDPTGRAIAISSTSGQLWIAHIKPLSGATSIDDMCSNIVYFDAQLTVLHLDFLPSTEEYKSTNHLLLIALDEEKAKSAALLLSWSSEKPLDRTSIHTGSLQPLPRELGVPNMLIPLHASRYPGCFLVVSHRSIFLLGNIFAGILQEIDQISIPPYKTLQDFQTSTEEPMLVNWSRPKLDAVPYVNTVYMIQDDGIIYGVEMEPSGSQLKMGQAFEVIKSSAGSKFACGYPMAKSDNPIIIAGDCRDSLIFFDLTRDSKSRNGIKTYLDKNPITFPNCAAQTWAPITDVTLIKAEYSGDDSDKSTSKRSFSVIKEHNTSHSIAAIAAAGRGPEGKLVELRHGIPIKVRNVQPIRSLIGADRVWQFPSPDQNERYFLASIFTGSLLLIDSSNEPIELEGQTLAASISFSAEKSAPILHRITTYSLRSIVLTNPDAPANASTKHPPGKVTAAVKCENKDSFFFATQTDSGPEIWTTSCLAQFESLALQRVDLAFVPDSEILSIEVVSASDKRDSSNYIAFTTAAGFVSLLHHSDRGPPELLLQHSFRSTNTDEGSQICESTVLVIHPSFTRMILLCGMRNGMIKCLTLEKDTQDSLLHVSGEVCLSFGVTTVSIKIDLKNPFGVFVSCESRVSHLLLDEFFSEGPQASRLILVESDGSVRRNQEIACFSQELEPFLQSGRDTSSFCYVCDKTLVSGDLSYRVGSFPLAYPWKGTPNRIIHSSHMNALIVSSTATEIDHKRKMRAHLPIIQLIRLSTGEPLPNAIDSVTFAGKINAEGPPTCIWVGEPGEHITALSEWFPLKSGEARQFIVAAILREHDDGSESGALKYIRLTTTRLGYISAGRDQESAEKSPVLALCRDGTDSLLYCADRSIRQRTFDSNTSRFDKRNLYTLHSRGLHISTHGAHVLVSTASHSLCILHFDATGALVPLINHDEARPSLHHLAIPNTPYILATDKLKGLIGLRVPTMPQERTGTRALFNVKLPCSVSRLFIANLRPYTLLSADTSPLIPQGVLARDIHGLAADGSTYTFALLTAHAWRLLRFVQNMTARSPLYAWRHLDRKSPSHLEPSSKHPLHFSADADILRLLVNRDDAMAMLSAWLDAEPASFSSSSSSSKDSNLGDGLDFATAADRKVRFKELVRQVRHVGGQQGGDVVMDDDDDDTEEVAREAVKYLRSVLALVA